MECEGCVGSRPSRGGGVSFTPPVTPPSPPVGRRPVRPPRVRLGRPQGVARPPRPQGGRVRRRRGGWRPPRTKRRRRAVGRRPSTPQGVGGALYRPPRYAPVGVAYATPSVKASSRASDVASVQVVHPSTTSDGSVKKCCVGCTAKAFFASSACVPTYRTPPSTTTATRRPL